MIPGDSESQRGTADADGLQRERQRGQHPSLVLSVELQNGERKKRPTAPPRAAEARLLRARGRPRKQQLHLILCNPVTERLGHHLSLRGGRGFARPWPLAL